MHFTGNCHTFPNLEEKRVPMFDITVPNCNSPKIRDRIERNQKQSLWEDRKTTAKQLIRSRNSLLNSLWY